MRAKLIQILNNNIFRSQKAYKIYLSNKKYYNAKRIYNANLIIYKTLKKLLKYKFNESEIESITNYIFHLEVWFLQFEDLELKIKNIDDVFIFNPYEDHFPFPKDFTL